MGQWRSHLVTGGQAETRVTVESTDAGRGLLPLSTCVPTLVPYSRLAISEFISHSSAGSNEVCTSLALADKSTKHRKQASRRALWLPIVGPAALDSVGRRRHNHGVRDSGWAGTVTETCHSWHLDPTSQLTVHPGSPP